MSTDAVRGSRSPSARRASARGTGHRPTMEDVAAEAGVSRALVSLVMRDSPKVSEGARVRVLDAAERLGYRPNLMARTLASRRTMIVGVMLDDLHNPFYSEISDGILAAAGEAGYRVLFTTRAPASVSQSATLETLLELRGDGVILVSPRLPVHVIEEAAGTTPLVAVSEPLVTHDVDTVTNDEEIGARLLVDHLVALGHRRISHVDGGQGAGAQSRRSAYVSAMRSVGLASEVHIMRGNFTEEAGYSAIDRMLAAPGPRPTAVFAANDSSAAGVLERLDEAGIAVPEEISVVGYDNTALAAMRRMSLTTVNQPRYQMGRLAFTTLLERIDGSRTLAVRHVIPPTLVVRRSSGPAPQ